MDRRRLSLDITKDDAKDIATLRSRLLAKSDVATICRGIRIANQVLAFAHAGSKVIVRHPGGKEETLLIV